MQRESNMLNDAELASLPSDVQDRFAEAEDAARQAVTLFDFGVARGLLLGMKRDGRIHARPHVQENLGCSAEERTGENSTRTRG